MKMWLDRLAQVISFGDWPNLVKFLHVAPTQSVIYIAYGEMVLEMLTLASTVTNGIYAQNSQCSSSADCRLSVYDLHEHYHRYHGPMRPLGMLSLCSTTTLHGSRHLST